MEEELSIFIKIWVLAITSSMYCYSLAKIPIGLPRILLVFPVIVLFTVLPFALNSVNFAAVTGFYLSWLGTFKILLFALGLGPLISQTNTPLSLKHFIAIALLPIKAKQESGPDFGPHSFFNRMMIRKLVLFVIAVKLLTYKRMFNYPTVQVLYFTHVSLGVEILLAVTAIPVKLLIGLDLDPQFRNPFMATSLQDFWGSRWNLMTSSILRLTVYNPLRRITTPMLGKRGGMIAGLLGSFTVSGLMHELTYYQYIRVRPTWEVTWFFILHGVCTALEVILKHEISRKFGWKPFRITSMCLTSSFLSITATWLFLPQLLRNRVDERLLEEYFYAMDYVKSFFV